MRHSHVHPGDFAVQSVLLVINCLDESVLEADLEGGDDVPDIDHVLKEFHLEPVIGELAVEIKAFWIDE